MALLACLCSFQHLFAGLTNRTLRELIAGLIPGYSARQMTYDLRRLRRKGLIQRIPHTQRYELTARDGRLAVFFQAAQERRFAALVSAGDDDQARVVGAPDRCPARGA